MICLAEADRRFFMMFVRGRYRFGIEFVSSRKDCGVERRYMYVTAFVRDCEKV